MSQRTIQNIFCAFKDDLEESRQPLKNRKAIYALSHCRTREMGVSFYQCEARHEAVEQFHSCRHRSCYLCAQKKRAEWVEAQKGRIFDSPHFHVIFTLPHEYLSLWRYNEKEFSRILFKASQKTLLELIGDKKYWGVTPGVLMTLHTWGRQLTLHPHTHCLVSAGGLSASGQWKSMNDFLLPGAVLCKVYRGKIQAYLREAFEQGRLHLPPDMSLHGFWVQYRALYKKRWSVRVQERYSHGKGVVLYLARYCKGGPLDPRQIQHCDDRHIEMRYLDHRDGRTKAQSLTPMQFMQRLLQHVPAAGVHTVRYYGLYAPASKRRHGQCLELHGSLAGVNPSSGPDLRTMLVYCRTCGSPAKLAAQVWPRRQKGISINKDTPQISACGNAQQGDQRYIANVVRARDPCSINA